MVIDQFGIRIVILNCLVLVKFDLGKCPAVAGEDNGGGAACLTLDASLTQTSILLNARTA